MKSLCVMLADVVLVSRICDAAFDHLRITDIAYAVGFQDISYFNRAFRNRYDARPSAVRGGS
jgi:AraC-like DNA-binding protein